MIQDPKTAEVAIMPQAAIRAVPSAEVLPLARLAPRLVELTSEESKPRRTRSTVV